MSDDGNYSANGEHPPIDLDELAALMARLEAKPDPLVALWLGTEAFEEFKERAEELATIPDDSCDRYALQGVEIRPHASLKGRTVVPVYRYRRELTPAERFRNPRGEYTGTPFKLAESKP